MSEITQSKMRKPRKKMPKHSFVIRSYDFVLKNISSQQHDKLWNVVSLCHELREKLVHDRINNRKECKIFKQANKDFQYLDKKAQYKSVSVYGKFDPKFKILHSQVMQNVAERVDEGYKRFFDAIKIGDNQVKPPKPILRKFYKSFTYKAYNSSAHIKNGKLHLSKLGEFNLRAHRKLRGKPRTVTIKWKQGQWHCIITVACQEKDVIDLISENDTREDIGIDPGLKTLLTDSKGKNYDPPKAFQKNQKRLKKAQRKMSRQFEARKAHYKMMKEKAKANGETLPKLSETPYSHRLKKQIKVVATIHTKVERIRDHWHKKQACVIAKRYRYVAVEEHSVKFMIANRKLAKAASDRAIHSQKLKLQSKLGARYHKTANQRPGIGGNSQTCLCGASVPKELKDRVHHCPECGLTSDRDVMSANIVELIAFGSSHIEIPKKDKTSRSGAGHASSHNNVENVEKVNVMCSESGHTATAQSESAELSVKRQSPAFEETIERIRQVRIAPLLPKIKLGSHQKKSAAAEHSVETCVET